jgi:uncharacterized protein YebE (UPF0316 family)
MVCREGRPRIVAASFLLLPLLIFFAEVCVLTVGTLRIIFVARGEKLIASALGFIEVLIWLFAITQVMQNLSDWTCFVAFALGFTLGTYFGMLIEKRLALGTAVVRVVTHRDATALVDGLRGADFGVTCVDANGASGKVQIVMTVVKRKRLPDVIALIDEHQPGAFYAVDDVQAANDGIFPQAKERPGVLPLPLAKMFRFIVPANAECPDHPSESKCSESSP